ncbi:MAG: Ku protein [Trueperaceae bacterium]|nr:Ku protein [Trueperaceae bacterium]
MPEAAGREEADARRARPLWSGNVAFGLVTLPVELFPANRTARVSLRMVDEAGAPLSRRYFDADGKALEDDDIVRGFALADGEGFVLVEDEELEALAPERSREIDLSRFVDLDEIDPAYFDRGYFLAPDRGALKAYRLLARTMEETGRAGIATFVMRDKEYLVAIIADDGILRAQTLRFHDELRTPDDVGLPDLETLDAGDEEVAAIERAIVAAAAEELDESLLRDRASARLLALVQEKLGARDDVVKLSPEAAEAPGAAAEVDLMQVLKERLARDDEATGPSDASAPGTDRHDLQVMTKAALYRRAQELEVPGRSSMTKEELVAALERTSEGG